MVSPVSCNAENERNVLIEVPQLPLIFNLDQLLRAVRRVRNVQLWEFVCQHHAGLLIAVEKKGAAKLFEYTVNQIACGNGVILTFMLAVVAERPSSMLRTERLENRRKVLCAAPNWEKS